MNCPEFQKLPFPEQVQLIGRLVVAVQSNSKCFKAASILLETAEQFGVFDKVKVGHDVFCEEGNHLRSEAYS